MIKINGRVYLSNGENIVAKFNKEITEGLLHRGKYSDGTEFVVGNYKIIFITEKLCEISEPDDEQLVELYKNNLFDFWFLKNFNGCNLSEVPKYLLDRIEQKEKAKKLKERIVNLAKDYNNIPDEIKEAVYNLDHYHQYTDDGAVWRSAEAKHKEVKNLLEQYENGLAFYSDYRNLIYSFNKS